MVDAYNLYLGGYLPKISPKTSVHNKRELKSKYKNIVSLNNANPLVMVRLSNDTQAYALNVKEMSMELAETAENVLDGQPEDRQKNMESMTELFNRLLKRSDEFGEANNRPSRPGGELRNLVNRNSEELIQAGFSIDSRGFLTAPEGSGEAPAVPQKFVQQLLEKCDHMGMNPMEYVDSKIYSYAHLHRSDIGTAYESSIYSGMLFNSYC
ncbi:MAG: hypothetical protein J1F02_11805 [Lachnospiraceae bacterium]|nr:hypothetical protein [Lachnospiraceae bacterium]